MGESSSKYGALIERNRNKLSKKGKSFKYESDSDGMDDFYNEFNTKEIKFLSKKHNFQKRRSQSFSLNRFSIDESVIEYHVPSVLNKIKRRNKNIKINIHINNDIVAKGKRSTKIKKSKELHQKSKSSFMSAVAAPANTFKHSQHASIDVSKSAKKKKKHKHKRHRSSKKSCSCQKHKQTKIENEEPIAMDRAHSSHYFSPRSSSKSPKDKKDKEKKVKKEKKSKKRKKEIKFRQKSKTPKASSSNSIRIPKGRRYKGSKTPKVGMPSAPIHSSPRFGRDHRRNESVPRFDWNDVCCE